MEYVANGKFKVLRELGDGSFGKVYLGLHVESGINVAIKVETLDVMKSSLLHEAKIYKALRGNEGYPDIYWAGT